MPPTIHQPRPLALLLQVELHEEFPLDLQMIRPLLESSRWELPLDCALQSSAELPLDSDVDRTALEVRALLRLSSHSRREKEFPLRRLHAP